MASRLALAAVVMLVVLLGAEVGHAVPLKRTLNIGWMNGMNGGSPGGMQPSDTMLHATVGEKGNLYMNAEEAKFIHTVPAFVRPPRLPPS
ncbi:hypothetical protein ACP70R_041102 [Stipagrostis hirtigluma subsp. patula]